jgi:hypothetical protein
VLGAFKGAPRCDKYVKLKEEGSREETLASSHPAACRQDMHHAHRSHPSTVNYMQERMRETTHACTKAKATSDYRKTSMT